MTLQPSHSLIKRLPCDGSAEYVHTFHEEESSRSFGWRNPVAESSVPGVILDDSLLLHVRLRNSQVQEYPSPCLPCLLLCVQACSRVQLKGASPGLLRVVQNEQGHVGCLK